MEPPPPDSVRTLRERQQLSRLLYGNPVCLLLQPARPALGFPHANAMVVSWLTPTDNEGHLFLSINAKRHSMACLLAAFTADPAQTCFVLCVPTAGQEARVLRVGGCSGRDGDKFAAADGAFTLCTPGWARPGDNRRASIPAAAEGDVTVRQRRQARRRDEHAAAQWAEDAEANSALVAAAETVAHIVCRVTEIAPDRPAADAAAHAVRFLSPRLSYVRPLHPPHLRAPVYTYALPLSALPRVCPHGAGLRARALLGRRPQRLAAPCRRRPAALA